MRKPRVLFVASFPPPVHGSSLMSQYILDSKVINGAFDCDCVNLSTSRKMDEIGKQDISKLWRLVSALIREFWLLTTHHYDLCYLAITCHGIGFLKDAPFVLLCKLFGRKIVIHQHNKGMANDADRWPYRWLLPLVYNNTKVILLSSRLYADIEKVVPRQNVIICPNGIPDADYIYEERNNGVTKILFLSNLIESKGVLVLLDALKLLKDKGLQFICDIVGGETREINAKRFFDEVNNRGLNGMVSYHGKQYGKDKEAFLRNADILAFPTFYQNECFPLVLLEAMQYGLPIVTTDEGGILDMVEDGVNGLICEKNDSVSLAERLELLINDEELRVRIGRVNMSKYKEQFKLDVFENKMAQIIKDAVSS